MIDSLFGGPAATPPGQEILPKGLGAETGRLVLDAVRDSGEVSAAEHYYKLAEDLAGPAAVQTESNLALFLAEHNRRLPEALRIAQAVASVRHDIFTEDTLAWALFKHGRTADALAASNRALRTGSLDERILKHAEAIRARLAPAL